MNEHGKISEIVTSAIGHWEDWERKDGYFGMCKEISKLEDYLDFLILQEHYKEALKRADVKLQEIQEAYGLEQLKLHDNAHLMKKEELVWR